MSYRFLVTFFGTTILVILTAIFWPVAEPAVPHVPRDLWSVRAIDTMKYSRDLAREKSSSASFEAVIEEQVKSIAGTGATHVAIATPYDPEFVTYLTRWVEAARRHNLKVWFRGNLAGWEGWFDYPRIGRDEHIRQTVEFIKANASLFQNGDIFTACPECENGGPGDPRRTGDAVGHRAFLIEEHKAVNSAFRLAGKNVTVGYPSMNYDVATLIMDRETTESLGGVVAIDHYVRDPKQIALDVKKIAEESGGKVFLGEFGAPIPDIHGEMTESEQAEWIEIALADLEKVPELIGLSYWVNVGGSTELWKKGVPVQAVSILTKYFQKKI